MARPRKFDQRIIVRFSDDALRGIQKVERDDEDRSDVIRAGASLIVAVRNLDVIDELHNHLMANETFEDFCTKAIRRAVLNRLATVAKESGNEVIQDDQHRLGKN
jgi:hypothetical protein